MKLINVRGCNGAGKTTLLRCFGRGNSVISHIPVARHAPIPLTHAPNGILLLGDYTPEAKGVTAGCDKIKTQQATKDALRYVLGSGLPDRVLLFEGVLVSTIYEPWRDFSREVGGMFWAFLDTPLDICLNRIQMRNGGKGIKEDQVEDKHRTLARVRQRALADGERVWDIRWDVALLDMKRLIESASGGAP